MKDKAPSLKMKNTYTIYKYVDGEKEELAHFHNIVTNRFKYDLGSSNGYQYFYCVCFGTGTSQPQETDERLESRLWRDIPIIREDHVPYERGTDHWDIKCTARVDASASYVGTVTEIGIQYTSSSDYVITRALITDSEGHPISITKTDIEALYVDIHIRIYATSSNGFEFSEWFYPFLTKSHSSSSLTTSTNIYLPRLGGSASFCMCSSVPSMFDNGQKIGSSIGISSSYDSATKKINYGTGRYITSNQISQRYINSIAMYTNTLNASYYYAYDGIPIGYWKFPNPEIFPNYSINGMTIGIGDGVTTDFIPPLNLWVKNTEELYIGGTLQERNNDYTCDHKNNLSKLIELYPSNFINILNNYKEVDNLSSTYNPFTAARVAGYAIIEWNYQKPLEWEMLEDPQIGITADYFVIGDIGYSRDNTTGYDFTGAIFILEYSEDRIAWSEAGRSASSNYYSYDNSIIDFSQPISSKYWRLRIDATNARYKTRIENCDWIYSRSATTCKLVHRGSPIHFFTPPPAGALITMNAQIDRPMKSDKFVMDIAPSFQL